MKIDRNLYLISGPRLLIDQELPGIKKQILADDGLETFNYQTIDLKEQNYDEVIRAVASLPVGTGKKLVVIKNADPDPEDAGNDVSQKNQLTEILRDKDHPAVVIFIFPDPPAGKKPALLTGFFLYTLAASSQGLIQLDSFKNDPAGLNRWIETRSAGAGKKIKPEAIKELLIFCGSDISQLSAEIDKLVTRSGTEEEITPDMVRDVTSIAARKTYQLTDSLENNSPREIIGLFRALLSEGDSAEGLLSRIIHHYHLLLEIKALQESGVSDRQITDQLKNTRKYNYYQVVNNLDKTRKLPLHKLAKTLKKLQELDIASKNGTLNTEVALEVILSNAGP